MTGPMVLWGGVTNTDPTALVAPSLAAGVPTDTLTTRSIPIVVSGPASWPGGVLVQLQVQTDGGAWVNNALTATGTTLALTRTASVQTIAVRGVATNGGTLTDSPVSAVLTVTVPAALTAVTTGGTPLAWRLRVLPMAGTAQPEVAAMPFQSLPLRATGPNRIVVDLIEDPEIPVRVTPSAVTWRALTSGGVVLGSGALSVGTAADYRITLTPSPQMRVLEITVTAPDASVTAVQYPVVLDA